MFTNTNRCLRSSFSVLFYNLHKYNNTPSAPITTTLINQQLSVASTTTKPLSYNYTSSSITSAPISAVSLINRHFCIISRSCYTHHSADSLKKMLNNLPFFACGKIVSGFGRGSKDLGIPTANYPLEVVKSLPDAIQPGVYYGWANVDNGPVYKMVMSIGWNPFYDNKEKSMETHILHTYNRDLYDCLLKVCIVGYLRPEQNFKSLDDLIVSIKQDIAQAEDLLGTNESNNKLKYHEYFLDSNGCVADMKNGKDTSKDDS